MGEVVARMERERHPENVLRGLRNRDPGCADTLAPELPTDDGAPRRIAA